MIKTSYVQKLPKFNESFIKNYNENSNKRYFLEIDVEYTKKFLIFFKILRFYLKEKKSKNVLSLFVV